MTGEPPALADQERLAAFATQAEEVRAYLVSVRGGAPFLSGVDGRLLLDWLEGGVPVAAILAAIDKVALRRRKARVRTRMSLATCKGEVNKTAVMELPGATDASGVSELAFRFREMAVPAELEALREALVDTVEAITASDPSDRVSGAITACRIFQEGAWDACASEHPALLAAAAEQLGPMKGVVSASVFEDLVVEVARDRLRQRFPVVCAQVVWDTLAVTS